MFFGKHQPVSAFAGQMPMAEGQMAMPGMAMPEVSGYAHPDRLFGAPGMPGYEAVGYAAPGVPETMHASHTQVQVPGCPPVFYGHTEYDVEVGVKAHVHIVRKGETVYKIAKRYGLDWREVAGYNHLGNPNLIYPGQRLLIPVH